MTAPNAAAPVVANIVLEANNAELSERAKGALLAADSVRVHINALDATADEFAPATLAFLLRNADRIYGIVDCCREVQPGYWEKLIETVPDIETGRWTVRLLASDPSSWEARVELHSPKGLFCLTSPIYFGGRSGRVSAATFR
jgi:hypothetical protein